MNEFMNDKSNEDIAVSVIIPVFNVEKYVNTCIHSVLYQTKDNIEIICIDDCSTDLSGAILDNLAEIDKRIKVIHFDNNCGRIAARKEGVSRASGKYVMFLDGDDFYAKNACETAFREAVRADTDILHFGTNVINAGNTAQYEYDSMVSFFRPYIGCLYGTDILEECFEKEGYNYNLVDKIYSAELCKKAFAHIDEMQCCMAEDMLLYFLLAYFAESYSGITDKLYNYNFGIGVSRPGKLDLEGLDKRCTSAEACFTINRFLVGQKVLHQYQVIYTKIERRLLSDNFDAWYYRLPVEDRESGYAIFEKHWGKDKVMLSFLYDIENKQYDINQKAFVIEQNRVELENRDAEIQQLQRMMNQKICDLDEKEKEIQRNSELLFKERENCANIQAEHDKLALEYDRISNSLSYRLGCGFTWIPRKIAWFIRKIKRKL